jgi:hypothetical protein
MLHLEPLRRNTSGRSAGFIGSPGRATIVPRSLGAEANDDARKRNLKKPSERTDIGKKRVGLSRNLRPHFDRSANRSTTMVVAATSTAKM